MDDATANDNGLARSGGVIPSGAHGYAALILVESLIHGLIAKGAISVEDALETLDVASDVTSQIAESGDGHSTMWQQCQALLLSISASLSFDRADG